MRYTIEDFKKAVAESISIKQVLEKLKLTCSGGNYAYAKKRINKFGLSTSHFLGQAYLKGKTHNWGIGIPFEEILVENSKNTNNSSLKRRLIKANLLEYRCYNCNLTNWLGKPISLELEHKNGIHSDCRLENLELLCPNCHSQTSTYSGKNSKKHNIT
jgi:Zn finger protein HypA/HybF involved in hydrogenase expression